MSRSHYDPQASSRCDVDDNDDDDDDDYIDDHDDDGDGDDDDDECAARFENRLQQRFATLCQKPVQAATLKQPNFKIVAEIVKFLWKMCE